MKVGMKPTSVSVISELYAEERARDTDTPGPGTGEI